MRSTVGYSSATQWVQNSSIRCSVAQLGAAYLIDPHLSKGEGHALLHVGPLLILLLQDVAGEQWRGRHHVVLLQNKKDIFNRLKRTIREDKKLEDINAVTRHCFDDDPDPDLTLCLKPI